MNTLIALLFLAGMGYIIGALGKELHIPMPIIYTIAFSFGWIVGPYIL